MMSLLQDALEMIRRRAGESIWRISPERSQVYAMLHRPTPSGLQVGDRAQMATLPPLRPERFYDLVVQVAIIPRGPSWATWWHPYLRRRAGREAITVPHPDSSPSWPHARVPLFQEQLLRMRWPPPASPAGGGELRRAFRLSRLGAAMREVEVKLRTGMARQGISGAAAEAINPLHHRLRALWLSGSHAASFALLAYASAYLKTHHPAAVLTRRCSQPADGFLRSGHHRGRRGPARPGDPPAE